MSNPIIQVLKVADQAYFNKKPVLSDTQYDIIYEAAEKAWPDDEYFKSVGATPTERKIKLAVSIPKMPQHRPDAAIAWVSKLRSPYIVEAKIDGIAGQLVYKPGKRNCLLHFAATRGDGETGQNVTMNAKHVIGVWPSLVHENKKTIVIHGEFTMHRSVFSKINNDEFANTRSLCNGMLRRDEPKIELLNQMVFVAYSYEEVGKPKPAKLDQTNMLAREGFITVNNCGPIDVNNFKWLQDNMKLRSVPFKKWEPFQHYFHEKPVTKEWILSTLEHLRKSFDLDLDGLVFTINEKQNKAKQYNYKVKPDVEDQEKKKGVLKEIIYQVSPRNLRKPVLVLEKPINFNGTQVKRCTLHNFSHVKKMQLGPGSIITLIKSGDVIPRIMAGTKSPQYSQPKKCETCRSKLVFNGTDLLCDNPKCLAFRLPRLVNFFKKLDVEEMGKGTVEIFAKAGYNTVAKILAMPPKKMAELDRMGEKSAATIIKNLKTTMSKWKLYEFMAASGIFTSEFTSLGEKILALICEKVSLKEMRSGALKAYQIIGPQIGPERAELFIERLPDFIDFYTEVNKVISIKFAAQNEGPLGGQTFVFTNFRDKNLERKIKDHGGKIGSSVTQGTNVLFTAGPGTKQSKAEELRKRGFRIAIVPHTKATEYVESLIVPF